MTTEITPSLQRVLKHPHLHYTSGDRADLNSYEMCGTERLWVFTPILVTPLGYVGVRALLGDGYRIRVVPIDDAASELMRPLFPLIGLGWKTPADGEKRFSNVSRDNDALVAHALTACDALLTGVSTVGYLTNSVVDKAGLGIVVNACISRALGNPIVPNPLADLVTKPVGYDQWGFDALVAEVQRRKLPGCNAAKGWKPETLIFKLQAADSAS